MTLNAPKIMEIAAYEKQLHENIHRTFKFRDSGKKKLYLQWGKACDDWHAYKSPFERLWSADFKSLVKSGDRKAINELITFLEVDPYFFHSGYLKGRLARIIKGSPQKPVAESSRFWNPANQAPKGRAFGYST